MEKRDNYAEQIYYRYFFALIIFSTFLWIFSITIHDVLFPALDLKFTGFILDGSSKARGSLHITNSVLVAFAFWFITGLGILAAFFLLLGSLKVFSLLHSNEFYRCKKLVIIGLSLTFIKYFIFFDIIASEWFYLWQKMGVIQDKALFWALYALVVMLFTMKVK